MTRPLHSCPTSRARSVSVAVGVTVLMLLSANACALTNPAALSVNGWSLSRKDLLASLDGISRDAEAAGYIGLTVAPSRLADRDPTEIKVADAAALLKFLIFTRVIAEEAARRNITITEEDRIAAENPQPAQAAANGQEPPSPGKLLAAAGEPLRPVLADGLAAYEAMKRVFAEGSVAEVDVSAEARDLFEKGKDQADNICVSAIVFPFANQGQADPTTGLPAAVPVPGSAEDLAVKQRATDALAQLGFGADFAALATSLNEIPELKEKAGDLGCNLAGNFAQQGLPEKVVALAAGSVSEAVELPQTGYALFKVVSREVAEFEDFKDRIEESLRQQKAQEQQQAQEAKVGEAITSVLARAAIHVDPLFGTWNPVTNNVDPPEGSMAAPTVPPTSPAGLPPGFDAPGASLPEEPGPAEAPAGTVPESPTGTTPGSTPGTTPGSTPGSTPDPVPAEP